MTIPLALLRMLVLGEVVPLKTFIAIDDPVMILAMATYLVYSPSKHGPSTPSPASAT